MSFSRSSGKSSLDREARHILMKQMNLKQSGKTIFVILKSSPIGILKRETDLCRLGCLGRLPGGSDTHFLDKKKSGKSRIFYMWGIQKNSGVELDKYQDEI